MSILVCLAACVLGCSHDPDPSGPRSIGTLAHDMAAAACDGLFRCGPDDDGQAMWRAVVKDEETCIAEFTRFVSTNLESVAGGVESGHVRYDGELAGECLAAQRASCGAALYRDVADIVEGPCKGVFTGTIPVGGECFAEGQCAGRWSICDFSLGACPGTCMEYAPSGCPDEPCVEGLFCYASELYRQRCVSQVIAPDGGEGDPCGEVISETETEITRGDCAPGLYCSSSMRRTCREHLPAGAACDGGGRCVAGHLCEAGVCQPIVVVDTVGGACGGTRVCDWVRGLGCDGTACVVDFVPNGAVGDPCGSIHSPYTCAPGLFCRSDTHTCDATVPLGSPCPTGEECATGRCIEGACSEWLCR